MKCQICGRKTKAPLMICADCMTRIQTETKEDAEELEDIAAILSITADTDGNIKGAMESILRIADRLKRREQSGRVQTQNSKSEVTHSRKNL